MKLSILELFFMVLPECLIFLLGIYFLGNKCFNKKRLITMALILAIEAYWVRMLPLHFGIHIFINIIFSIILSVNIGNISIIQSISYNLIIMIILSISEFISMLILRNIFKIYMLSEKLVPSIRVLYFIPSFILFTFNIFIMKKLIDRREKCKNI